MKHFLIAVALLGGLSVLTRAQQRPAKSVPAPSRVEFGALTEYINDFDKRRAGQRIIVGDVALAAGSEKHDSTGMFILRAGAEDKEVQLFTSPALARRLGARPQGGSGRTRITCTLVEFRGEFDIGMVAFVTSVEALAEDGSVLWTESGPPPIRLRYRT